jgi:RimJ/RimL family protein N-acetyltransferase
MKESGNTGENMIIRQINANDTERFFDMMCSLDEETDYMMYEPGERREKTKNLNRLRGVIEDAESGGDLLLGAVKEDGVIVGFIWAERGTLNRVRHTAYIVTGVRAAYRRQGIGTEFFRRLDDWAKENGLIRLELTVECPNTAAKSLYEKQGFVVEGIKKKTMKVNGSYVDEYCMGKIINET